MQIEDLVLTLVNLLRVIVFFWEISIVSSQRNKLQYEGPLLRLSIEHWLPLSVKYHGLFNY